MAEADDLKLRNTLRESPRLRSDHFVADRGGVFATETGLRKGVGRGPETTQKLPKARIVGQTDY